MSKIDCDVECFDLNKINPTRENFKTNIGGSKIVIIGKPGTGKSTLIANIFYEKSDIIPVALVTSGTEDSNKFYEKFVPSAFIHYEYDENIIQQFVKRQKYAVAHLKDLNPWAILLLDDCTDDKSVFKSKLQNALFKNGRHWKMLYILSLQHSTDIPPSIRTSVDGVFIFRETNENNLQNIYKNYAGVIPKYEYFKIYMNKLTENYTAIYIDNTSQTNKWQDCVYYYKASHEIVTKGFAFGCDEYKEFSETRLKS